MPHRQRITLDTCASPIEGRAGQWAAQAITSWQSGDRVAAEQAYQRAHTAPAPSASTCANLALFNLLRQNPQAALAKAKRAVSLDPTCLAGWINLSAAALQVGDSPQVLLAARQAAAVAPHDAKTLLNLGRVLFANGEETAALETLQQAASLDASNWRITLELATVFRAQSQPEQARRYALSALTGAQASLPARLDLQPRPPSLNVSQAGKALCDAAETLEAAGISFFLIAGTALALVRDGDLLSYDKDIDLGLAETTHPDAVAAAFEADARFIVPSRPHSHTPLKAFGVTHQNSNITIDLFFSTIEADGVHFGHGLPANLIESRTRPFGLTTLRWRNRDWQIPDPVEAYFEDIYGPNWQTPDRYFDTTLSNPSRTAETLPRAINLGLLRLANAIADSDWARAHALCRQLLARESFPEVSTLMQQLEVRCQSLQP